MITIRVAAAILLLHMPFGIDRWLGADKVKHFLMSALIQSATFSVARTAGVARPVSQGVGAAAVMTVGVWKELKDRREKKPFSVEDLFWDAMGGVVAASLMNGSR